MSATVEDIRKMVLQDDQTQLAILGMQGYVILLFEIDRLRNPEDGNAAGEDPRNDDDLAGSTSKPEPGPVDPMFAMADILATYAEIAHGHGIRLAGMGWSPTAVEQVTLAIHLAFVSQNFAP